MGCGSSLRHPPIVTDADGPPLAITQPTPATSRYYTAPTAEQFSQSIPNDARPQPW